MDVRPIENKMAHPWIKKKHYAHRLPPIQFSFALVENEHIQGIVTYGNCCGPSISRSALGRGHLDITKELNRLCLDTDIPNAASILISKSLKLLPGGLLVVSYADDSMKHVGCVYQASNWLYCGLRESHDIEYFRNGKWIHTKTLTKSGISAPRKWALANNIPTRPTGAKHRYCIATGNKREKRKIYEMLKWEILPYPKAEKVTYDAGEKLSESETSLAKPIDPQGELF